MKHYIKTFYNYIIGFLILIGFYFISYFIIKLVNVALPPAILGLILFAIALTQGIIKENLVKPICEFLIKNMAMFLAPFLGGLIAYKAILMKNWIVILVVVFITTTITIVITGLFVEWGIKFLRIHKINKLKKTGADND